MKKYIWLLLLFLILIITGCDKTITIKFDSDGGSLVTSIELAEPGKIEKPEDPEKDGFVFAGWYANGSLFDFDTVISKSITLKAKWENAVTLNLNSAGFEEQILLVPQNSTYKLPVLERNGYNFLGWYDSLTNEKIEDDYVFVEDMMLTAKWYKKTQYAVTYFYNSIILKEDITFEGDEYTPFVPNLEGFTFVGYYTSTDYTTEFNFDNLGRTNYIYAKFTPNTYKITFGTTGMTADVLYSNRIGKLPTLNLSGCTFYGWEYQGKAITAQTTYLYNFDITVTPIITTRSIFVLEEGNSKIAQYKVGDYTPYVTAKKEGFIFAGWYADQNFTGEPIYVITTTDFANKSLYAKWVQEDDADNTYSQKLVDLIVDYYSELYSGALVYENLSLPTNDAFYGCNLRWASSNRLYLQDNGALTRDTDNVDVDLTLTVSYNNITETVTFNLTVKGNPYKDISKSVISSYVYTGTFSSHPVDEMLLNTADVINLLILKQMVLSHYKVIMFLYMNYLRSKLKMLA